MKIVISLILFFFCSAITYAEQVGVALKDMPLREEPSKKSETIISIAKNDEVLLLERKGGWYKAQAITKQVGWIRMLDIRFLAVNEKTSTSLADLLSNALDVSPSGNATTGVRGMSEGELEESNVDQKAQMKRIDSFIPTANETSSFAKEGKLESQPVVIKEN